jgi:hypothetical protein
MTVLVKDDDLEVLPIAALRIDMSYQRERKEHLIRKILRKGFDMNAAFPIIVSERPPAMGMTEPRFFIVDGQHRTASAERIGETEVICKVIHFRGSEAKLVQQEADLRTKMGERKPDTPMERFKSKLRSGDDEALRIDSLVESFGGRIAQSQSQGHAIHAISTLEKLYRRDVLTSVLRIIKDAWDTFDGRAGEASMLDALAWLVQKHPDYDSTHLIRRLRGTPPEAVHARATAIQSGMGGSLWKNYYRAMLEFYNQRAPAKVKKLTAIDF